MRFMLMIKGTKQTEAGLLPSKRLMERMIAFNAALVDAGALLAAEGLHPSSTGARVKFTGGKPAVANGPFPVTEEIVAGYWLIRAKSKEAAIEWAKSVPFEVAVRASDRDDTGQIEVRPVFELGDFPIGERESRWREAKAEFRARAAQYAAGPASGGSAAKGLKRFVIFRKADQDTEAGVTPGEVLLAAMGSYNEEMNKAGVLLAGEGLQPSSKGERVYHSAGKQTVVDGPFAGTRELVAGFTLIQTGSLAEALDWARRWPPVDGDGEVELEVRQLFGADEFAAEYTAELARADAYQRQLIAALQWPPEY